MVGWDSGTDESGLMEAIDDISNEVCVSRTTDVGRRFYSANCHDGDDDGVVFADEEEHDTEINQQITPYVLCC
jgi:hypothetical protein